MNLRYLIPFLALFLGACSTMKVSSDYDPTFDFTPLASFAVVYPKSSDGHSLTQGRIADALVKEMKRKGYRESDKEHADFIVLFHTDVVSKQQVVTDYQMVGYYPYYGGYGWGAPMAVPVTREYNYDEGKIIIDALDPDGNKIFWRAVATDRLKTFDTPQERIEYIRTVVTQSLKSFPDR